MSELKQAGHYALKSFKIIPQSGTPAVDIKMLIHKFNIIESMSSGNVRGSAVVYDANDLITKMPIRAEEYIEISYTDYFDEEITETYFLYSITDVGYAKEDSPDMVKYTLNFVSLGKLFSENFRVAKTYRPTPTSSTISDYVKELFDEYYVKPVAAASKPTKEIDVTPTVGQQSYVIPRMTPEQAMHFFSRKAYTSDQANKSQSFRFFETRQKYYFATNEYMAQSVATGGVGYGTGAVDPRLASAAGIQGKSKIVYTRNYATDRTADAQTAAMSRLLALDFGVKTDTIGDINSGAYYRNAYEVDMINGTLNKVEYNHFEFNSGDLKFPHEQSFVDQYINKPKERFIIKDYASAGAPTGSHVPPDRNYSALHNVKTSYFYHYDKNKVSATIYGRNTIFAGSVITLELSKHTADATGQFQRDEERSGDYIIESVENLFSENIYTQKLVLSRSGIGA